MDFSWSRDEEEFRQEIHNFLQAELPQGWNDTLVLDKESEEYIALAKDFTRKVGAKGWLAAHWPQEYGGLGWSFWQYFIMNEEMVTSDAPLIGMNGPKFLGLTIIHYGTEEQKNHHLPGIAKGEPKSLLTPAKVTDRTDPQLVHLDGLNLSRAWCMRGIASALAPDDPVTLQLLVNLLVSAGKEGEAQAYMAKLPQGTKLDANTLLNLGIKTGQYLKVGTQSSNKLLTSIMNAFGHPATGLGIEPNVGPLAGVL